MVKPVGIRSFDEIVIKFDYPEVYYTFIKGRKIITREVVGEYPYNPQVIIQYNFRGDEIQLELMWQGEDGRPIEEEVSTNKLSIQKL